MADDESEPTPDGVWNGCGPPPGLGEFEPLGSLAVPPPSSRLAEWQDVLEWAQYWRDRARAVSEEVQDVGEKRSAGTIELWEGVDSRGALPGPEGEAPLHIGHPLVEAWIATFEATYIPKILALECDLVCYVPATSCVPSGCDPELGAAIAAAGGPPLAGFTTGEDPYRAYREAQAAEQRAACHTRGRALLPAIEIALEQLREIAVTADRAPTARLVRAVQRLQILLGERITRPADHTFGQGSF